ncbi:DinB family protein [Paenibacillus sp. 1001270B_150601_E10]|uniref:DinB family protein n=1 Tax=Paenibacillus sp. 1001270B_150601_E10 TaxID=2787079 RepID=UPI0018A06438|nr:DinB family protein [Paenibacillus sp. 1001270B_150601_E10]
MAKTIEEINAEFKSYIAFVLKLDELSEEHWNSPIAEGKWTLKEVITHIMLWDKYFYEEAIEKIKQNKPLTVKHLNFNEFNANAIEYSKKHTKKSIVDQFVEYRMKITNDISEMNEDECTRDFIDGDKKKFSVRKFLRGFIPHDKHHKKQIEKFLKSIEG